MVVRRKSKNKSIDNKVAIPILRKRKAESYRISYFFTGFIYIALFLFLNFILYITAGDYSIFNKFGHLNTEIFMIFGVIIIVSFLLMLLFAFSRFLSKLFLALFTGCILYIFMDMFLAVDISYFIMSFQPQLSSFLDPIYVDYILSHGNVILSAVIAFILFITLLLNRARFIGVSSLVLVGLISVVILLSSITLKNNNNIDDKVVSKEDMGNSLVYIILNRHGNFVELNEYFSSEYLKEPQKYKKYLDIVAGFYANYNFELFNNSFNTHKDSSQSVMANMNFDSRFDRNIDSKDMKYFDEDYSIGLIYYNNDSFNLKPMKENELFKNLKQNGYNINVYNTKNVDLCSVGEIDKCRSYITKPISVDNLYLDNMKKMMILVVKWLNALHIFDYKLMYKLIGPYIDKVEDYPFIYKQFNEVYAANQFNVIDDMITDMKGSDKSKNNAYIAYLMLPSSSLVFDQYCRVQNEFSEWQSLGYNDWQMVNDKTIEKTHKAYGEQIACSYGMIGKLMENMKHQGMLDKSVVVIHGDVNIGDKKDVKYKRSINDEIKKMRNNYFTTYAIFDSGRNKFIPNNVFCDISSLLSARFGNVKKCVGLEDLKFHPNFNVHINKLISNRNQFLYDYDNAKKVYQEWHIKWNDEYSKHIEDYQKSYNSLKKPRKEIGKKAVGLKAKTSKALINIETPMAEEIIEPKYLIEEEVVDKVIQSVEEPKATIEEKVQKVDDEVISEKEVETVVDEVIPVINKMETQENGVEDEIEVEGKIANEIDEILGVDDIEQDIKMLEVEAEEFL